MARRLRDRRLSQNADLGRARAELQFPVRHCRTSRLFTLRFRRRRRLCHRHLRAQARNCRSALAFVLAIVRLRRACTARRVAVDTAGRLLSCAGDARFCATRHRRHQTKVAISPAAPAASPIIGCQRVRHMTSAGPWYTVLLVLLVAFTLWMLRGLDNSCVRTRLPRDPGQREGSRRRWASTCGASRSWPSR